MMTMTTGWSHPIWRSTSSTARAGEAAVRDESGQIPRQGGQNNASDPLNSNIPVNNTLMGKTSSRKRKQTDGEGDGHTGKLADIRSLMKKSKKRDKIE